MVGAFYQSREYLTQFFIDFSYNIFSEASESGIELPEINKIRWENLLRTDPNEAIEKLIFFIMDCEIEKIIRFIKNLTNKAINKPIKEEQNDTLSVIENKQIMMHAYILNAALKYVDNYLMPLPKEHTDFILKELYFKSELRFVSA